MKKFVLFSLLFLSLNGLYAMGGGGIPPVFPYEQLAPELLCKIARYVLPDQMFIAPEDALQDVAEYGHMFGVRSVAWSPDSERIVSGGDDGRVKIANPATGEVQAEYTRMYWVESVAWSPDGERIALGGHDGRVKIANPATGEVQVEYTHGRSVESVAWSPDSTRIASGGADRVKIANPATGEVQVEYAHGHSVESVAWSPDGERIASGGADRVKIANPATGEIQAEYGHGYMVESVAWSPDGTRIASGSHGGRVQITNPATGEVQAEYAHGRSVESVAWSPDGERIAWGRYDGRVQIVNSATGEVQAEYAHGRSVESVAWSPDGTYIASGESVATEGEAIASDLASDDYNRRVKIKSVVPLLLATHQLEHPTLSRYFLLKRLQDSLLKNKKLLIVGESGKGTLEEMPELKKLLSITPSKPGAQHLAWRLQLKRFGETISQGGGIPAAHAGGEYAADLEEEEQ